METSITQKWRNHALASVAVLAVAGMAMASGGRVEASKRLLDGGGPGGAMRFTENRGQWDQRAQFLGRSPGLDVWMTENSVVFDAFQVRRSGTSPLASPSARIPQISRRGHVVTMSFEGGQAGTAQGWGRQLGIQNYIRPGAQASGARMYSEARLRNVYAGIDVRLYFDGASPRYDFLVAPGVDPSVIRTRFDGATSVSAINNTTLQIGTSIGNLRVAGLMAYQYVGAHKVEVPVRFQVNADRTVSYSLGKYDTSKALVIDPIVFSSLLGGSASDDIATGVAVDRFNNAYVAGFATASTFPTTNGAYDEQFGGAGEGFVSKFTADGADLIYSTYIGGSDQDVINAVVVNVDGQASFIGGTLSTDLPVANAQDATSNGSADVFYGRLSADGASALFLSYLGGAEFDTGTSLAQDSLGALYLTGRTSSVAFPTVSPISGTLTGSSDTFVTKVNGTGSALVYSTYLGGNDANPLGPLDIGVSIAVDRQGFAYVLSRTNSAYPTTTGAYDRVVNNLDAHIAKLNVAGSALVLGTFLGGNNDEFPAAIAIDSDDNIYVAGNTLSFNFPRTAGAYDRTFNLGRDAFLTKMNRAGNTLIYSTFLNTLGELDDPSLGAFVTALRVDDLGFAHIAGTSAQSNDDPWIPLTSNADQGFFGGGDTDAFLLVMNQNGTAVTFCSYYGGSEVDEALGLALDGPRNSYLVGYTLSVVDPGDELAQFPTTIGSYKEGMADAFADGFLVKTKTRIPFAINSFTISPTIVRAGLTATGTITISGTSQQDVLVSLTNSNPQVASAPSTLTIAPGQTSVSFTIETSGTITDTQEVSFTAAVEGDSRTAGISVRPWLEALTLSNDVVVGGNTLTGRVNLNFAAPAGGITVVLESSVATVASVPQTVTVQPGSVTAQFDIPTIGVANEQVVSITASFLNVNRSKLLRVIPARLLALSIDPDRVSGGSVTSALLQLDGNAAPGGVTVALASNLSAATVPATVTIAAGQRQVSFPITTTITTLNETATITATLAGSNPVSDTLNILVTNLITLTVIPDSVLGGNTSVGTVGLDVAAGQGGATVSLVSSDPSVAQVPTSVVIAAGSTIGTFTITTSNVLANTTVQITATRGSVSLQAPITVRPVSFAVTVAPTSVVGGQSAQGRVLLGDPAPSGGVLVTLATTESAVTLPTSVTILAGSTEATFTAETVAVASDRVATITASVGSVQATANLTVLGAVPTGLSINPSSVPSGGTATGTVTLSGAAGPGGRVVSLTSDSSAAVPPASVTVPQGATSANFQITTTPVSVQTVATITASAGSGSASDTLTVVGARLTQIRFSPARVRGGQSTQLTLTLSAAAPPGGAVVNLTSSNPSIATIPATITIPEGQTSRTVTVTTRRVSRALATQVRAEFGGEEVSTILTVVR